MYDKSNEPKGKFLKNNYIFYIFLGLYKEIPADLSPDERLLQLLDKSLLVRKLHYWMSAYPQSFVGTTLSLLLRPYDVISIAIEKN